MLRLTLFFALAAGYPPLMQASSTVACCYWRKGNLLNATARLGNEDSPSRWHISCYRTNSCFAQLTLSLSHIDSARLQQAHQDNAPTRLLSCAPPYVVHQSAARALHLEHVWLSVIIQRSCCFSLFSGVTYVAHAGQIPSCFLQ